jgi:hypothetical protein
MCAPSSARSLGTTSAGGDAAVAPGAVAQTHLAGLDRAPNRSAIVLTLYAGTERAAAVELTPPRALG